MMNMDEMAEREAGFRLGKLSGDKPDPETIALESKRRRGISLFGYDSANRRPLSLNGWSTRLVHDPEKDIWKVPPDLRGPVLRHIRNADLIGDLAPYGDLGNVYADMRDSVSVTDARFPILQYNRLKGSTNALLWPLRRVHDIGSGNFFGEPVKDDVPFEGRRPCIFWRGNLAGFSNLDGDIRNVRLLVDDFVEGRIDEDLLKAHLDTVPRYRFVSAFATDPRVDAGFVMSERHSYLAEIRLIAPFVKPLVPRSDYILNRYLVALSGTDVSTVFGWAPGADVLVFKEDYDYEVFFDCHFDKDMDFLSVRRDFSDVLEQFEWAESNPSICREMIAHANSVASVLGRPVFRERANAAFLELYRDRARSL